MRNLNLLLWLLLAVPVLSWWRGFALDAYAWAVQNWFIRRLQAGRLPHHRGEKPSRLLLLALKLAGISYRVPELPPGAKLWRDGDGITIGPAEPLVCGPACGCYECSPLPEPRRVEVK
jgi:hypothetical protein